MPDRRRTHRFVALSLIPIVPMMIALACDVSDVTTNPGAVATAAGACPDFSSAQAVAKIDFAAEFGIDAAVGGKIKSGVSAALELQAFSARLEADLKAACGGLAQDLGAAGPWNDAEGACKAAMSAMADVKAKIGGSARLVVDIVPPRCSASMDAMADCVAQCDANVEPGSVDVQCEKGKLAGSCEAECSGTCEMSAAAKCEGTCQGSCSAKFSGSCGGECSGTCDGKKVNGATCMGKCQGSCSANAEGSCGGQCSGECELSGSAKCEGTCHGECSVEMKAPKCEGTVTPPKASAECNANCDAKLQAQLECTPARVSVRIEGGADAKAVAQYKAALEKNLPAVLKIAVGMKDQALAVAGNVKAVVDGVQTAVSQVKAAPAAGARLAGCVAAPLSAAVSAAASVKANVSVSVDVHASASASASGSASGSAG